MSDTSDKQSQDGTVKVDYLSDTTVDEMTPFVGKTIARVEAHEYSLFLYFTDGSVIHTHGSNGGGSSLWVEVELRNEIR